MRTRGVKRLGAARSLRSVCVESTKGEQLLSVYCGTAEGRLRKKRISLRIRHVGGERIQTIKTQTSDIPFSQSEWEHKIDDDEPDLRFARGTPLAPLLTKAYAAIQTCGTWGPSLPGAYPLFE
jgi:inorganic triphosphatase YgiF